MTSSTRSTLCDPGQAATACDFLGAVLGDCSDAVISVHPDGLVHSFNPAAERIFGLRQADILGQPLELLLPQRYRDRHVQQRHQFGQTQAMPRMMGLLRVKGQHANGTELDLEGRIAQVVLAGEPLQVTLLRDVTAQVAQVQQQKQQQAQLAELAGKLMAQEKDLTKRLAQSLHDQLGQTMAAIRIVYDTLSLLRGAEVSSELLRLERQLGGLIDQAMRQVRVVLTDLRPPTLDEHGLVTALDNELRNRALLHAQLDFVLKAGASVRPQRWPTAVEYAVFMIAREAIENAVRHAGAKRVSIELAGGSDRLELDVLDDGRGFQQGKATRVGSLGVTGMLERASGINASLSVSPAPKGGTRVWLQWNAAA